LDPLIHNQARKEFRSSVGFLDDSWMIPGCRIELSTSRKLRKMFLTGELFDPPPFCDDGVHSDVSRAGYTRADFRSFHLLKRRKTKLSTGAILRERFGGRHIPSKA
jgi:hypothetical protein